LVVSAILRSNEQHSARVEYARPSIGNLGDDFLRIDEDNQTIRHIASIAVRNMDEIPFILWIQSVADVYIAVLGFKSRSPERSNEIPLTANIVRER